MNMHSAITGRAQVVKDAFKEYLKDRLVEDGHNF
jgi:hypothetical protein